MKIRKYNVIVTGTLSFVSLTAFTLIYFRFYPEDCGRLILNYLNLGNKGIKNYIEIITSGVFTGSFLSLIIYFSEYRLSTKNTLESYYLESEKFIKEIKKIEIIDFREPIHMIKDYFLEKSSNDRSAKMNDDLRSVSKIPILEETLFKISHDKENILIRWMVNNIPDYRAYKDEDFALKLASLELNENSKNYLESIDRLIRIYHEIAKFDFTKIDNSYAEIDFLVSNKTIRNNLIYRKIHFKQRRILQKIRDADFHFGIFLNAEEPNVTVLIDAIIELQEYMTTVELRNDSRIYYNKRLYKLDKNFYLFFKIIYGRKYNGEYPKRKNYILKSIYYNLR